MNQELERRWQKSSAPFHGQTVAFASEGLTPLPALRLALLAVTAHLQRQWPASVLFTLDDWHEHDGFINEARPTSWQELSLTLASDEALLTLSHGDFLVRRAFFPQTYDFYLRVYIPADYDNDHPERRGDFDVTCTPPLAAELKHLAASASGLKLVEYSAKDFFDRRYGG